MASSDARATVEELTRRIRFVSAFELAGIDARALSGPPAGALLKIGSF